MNYNPMSVSESNGRWSLEMCWFNQTEVSRVKQTLIRPLRKQIATRGHSLNNDDAKNVICCLFSPMI